MEKIRVAAAGKWHLKAESFAERILRSPDCELVSVWAEESETARGWAAELGCAWEESYVRMAEDPRVDAVMITAPTTMHDDMILTAAAAGKHIFVEKAPMLDVKKAEAARELIRNKKLHFVMSDPAENPQIIFAKKLYQSGVLGRIAGIHIRECSDMLLRGELPCEFLDKEKSGGGILLDLGFHAMHVLSLFLGMPKSAVRLVNSCTEQARTGGFEDSAAVLYEYANGVMAVAECSWILPRYMFELELLGTKGCLYADDREVRYRTNGGEWSTVSGQELPPKRIHPMDDWIRSMVTGEESGLYTVDEAVRLTKMLCMTVNAESGHKYTGGCE